MAGTRLQASLIVFSVSIGCAIPTLLLGRAVFAVFAFVGFAALLLSSVRLVTLRHLVTQLRTPLGAIIALTICVWTVSAFGSITQGRSLEAVVRTGAFIAIGAMVFAGLRSDSSLHRLSLQALVISSAIVIVASVLMTTLVPELYWALKLKGWQTTPLHPVILKSFSSLSVIAIPLLAWCAWTMPPAWRNAAVLAAIGFGYLVLSTNNRAAIAGLWGILVATGFSLLLRNASRRNWVSAVSAIAVISIILVGWLKYTRGGLVAMAPNSDWLFPVWLIDFQRQTIWAHAVEVAKQAPWLGVGANAINFLPNSVTPLPGNEALHIIPAHPHNWVVEILAETGALGLAVALCAIGGVFLALFRAYRDRGEPNILVAVAIMAGYWVSGLFNFSYWSAWWQVAFILGLAISLSLNSGAGGHAPND